MHRAVASDNSVESEGSGISPRFLQQNPSSSFTFAGVIPKQGREDFALRIHYPSTSCGHAVVGSTIRAPGTGDPVLYHLDIESSRRHVRATTAMQIE